MKPLGDITKISGAEIPVVDVITGGSPCQDLSVAGLRKGLKHEESGDDETTRSGLFMDQVRIVKEMRKRDRENGRTDINVRPRYMVWENVPGAFSSNGGKDFQTVLTEIVKIVCEDAPDVPLPEKGWPKAGCIYDEMGRWSLAYRLHDAQYWGVPQRRKRIALVADFNGLTAPEILFDPQLRGEAESAESNETIGDFGTKNRPEVPPVCNSLQGNSDESGTAWKGTAESTFGRSDGTGTGALSFQERAGKPGGAKDCSCRMKEQEHCQPSQTNPSSSDAPQAFGICSFDSNAMKSPNPRSGFYEADTSRTLDLNGGNPACNQGGGISSSHYIGTQAEASCGCGGLPEWYGKPFCERHSASERAGAEPQLEQCCKSAEMKQTDLGTDLYNGTITGGVDCSGRKRSETFPSRERMERQGCDVHAECCGTTFCLDHVLLSGGTTFQGRGWYDEVSGCMKTMPHGVMTDETDGS